MYIYPLTIISSPIQCMVYSNKPPHEYVIQETCIQQESEKGKGKGFIQQLQQTIYNVASNLANTSALHQHLAQVVFENDTKINVWTRPETKQKKTIKTNNLVTVFLQFDKSCPPISHMQFNTQEQCKDVVSYLTKKQEVQYRTLNQLPLLVSNPRFARIPVDQWHNSYHYPLYMVYDQTEYTTGDWNDLWLHAMFTSYTKMQRPNTRPRAKVRPRVQEVMKFITHRFIDKHSPYVNLSPETTSNTLYYVFQKHQKGVFIRIKDNTLDTFLPFVRQNFTNDYYAKLYLPAQVDPQDKKDIELLRVYEKQLQDLDTILHSSDPERQQHLKDSYTHTLQEFLRLEYECSKRFSTYYKPKFESDALRKNPNRRHWLANNHFFNSSLYYENPNIYHFKYLFEQLVKTRKQLPDIEFVFMPRDYPVLKAKKTKETTAIYCPFPDVQDVEKEWMRCSGGLTPIFSHTGKDGYYDVPMPTVDDVEHYTQMYFANKCNASYITSSPLDKWVDWKDKTISKAVFRGSATGRGVDEHVNQRLCVMKLSKDHPKLLDAKLVAFNDKYKTEAQKDGLQKIQRKKIQEQVGSISKSNFMDYESRKSYKYNLCLDGHTRADRFINELCTGSVAILPTTNGHRLWIEPFLKALSWDDIQRNSYTMSTIAIHGYTHITISQLNTLPQLIQWLQTHDNICKAIVQNTKKWLFDRKSGYYLRADPKTSFLYDYMEGVLRSLGKQYLPQKYILPLVSPVSTPKVSVSHKLKSVKTTSVHKQHSKKALTSTKSIVGIVVGFRDSELNGLRTQQLQQFCAFWEQLAPQEFHYTIVIVEQVIIEEDKIAFNKWWETNVQPQHPDKISVYTYIQLLEHHHKDKTLPHCVVRNIELVNNDCYMACGIMKGKRIDLQNSRKQKWTSNECFRRTGEQKFNLGALKNAGYAHLKDTYGTHLSHVVFTDIDMLPDHQLAPYYAQVPQPNEIIALATRGTVYDHFTIDNMPIYTLMQHPMHLTHAHTPAHTTYKAHGGKRKTKTLWKKSFKRRNTQFHTHKEKYHSLSFEPTTLDGRKCVPMWMRYKFDRFVGASVSFSTTLFETINGYPNSFWGWGGEDDELKLRFKWVEALKICPSVKFTIPPRGRVIDLEIAQPVTIQDKLAFRVKELQKNEKLEQSEKMWQTDGLKQIRELCSMTYTGLFQKFSNTEVLKIVL